jgi:hypothetical protein
MSQASEIVPGNSDTSVANAMTTPSSSEGGKEVVTLAQKTHEKISKESIILERPGRGAATWEQWLFTPGRDPELLPRDITLPNRCERLITLPSSTLFAWALWVAGDGDILSLVRMELSGRHLLKRGMEESLVILPILRQEDRQLILAVAPEEPFPGDVMPPQWKSASRFELPARLLEGGLDQDLIIWEEWNGLQMAFFRNQQPVWFCGARPQGLAGLIHRTSLRLLAENVLEQLPTRILLEGISERTSSEVRDFFGRIFPQAKLTTLQSGSRPRLPVLPFDVPPTEAREERRRAQHRQKLFSFAIAGVILYLLLLLWGAGDLLIRQSALKRLRAEIAKVEQPALEAQQQSNRWHQFRPVIDPTTYALDLLAAVAAPTDGGKVRLTLFSLEPGHLHLSGETTDVTQAYGVIEQLKKNPILQEYDWSSGQPQIAGKNSVKFDMEGVRPDAAAQNQGNADQTP